MSTSARAQGLERLGELGASLAQADHQRALRVDRIADIERHLLRPREHVQRAVPPSALADRLLEALHGLEVVVEDVGAGIHDGLQAIVGAVEVGDEHLDAHAGRPLAHREDRLGEDARPAVGQVVARDAGHDDVLETELADGLRDAARLVVVEPGRAAGLHGAEPAGPGARVAEDHDRGRALVPALPDVRAVGLLADGVQVEAAEQALELVEVVTGRHPGADPVGVAPEGDRAVGSRETGRSAATDRDRQVRARVMGGVPRARIRTSGAREPCSECSASAAVGPRRGQPSSKVARRPVPRSRGR